MTTEKIRCGFILLLAAASACSVRDGVLGTTLSNDHGGRDARSDAIVADSPNLVVTDSPVVAMDDLGGAMDSDKNPADGSVDTPPDSGIESPDAAVETTDGSTPPASCLSSPVVTLSKNQACVNALAASTFTNALCTCADLKLGDYLNTRGFDSNWGPYRPTAFDSGGAAVGVDGNYTGRSTGIDIRGSFSVAGFGALQVAGDLQVLGDFYAAGSVSVSGSADVWRNAWLGTTFTGLGPFTVGGSLRHTGDVTAKPLTAASDTREVVSVAKPCACGLFDLVDVLSLVDAARTSNDNTRFAVDPKAFARLSGNNEWTIGCGQLYLSQIGGTGNLLVHVTGLAALFIDGSINLTGDLSFDVAPGAEIDVFVKGDLALQGTLALASKDRPAAGRIWVWGALPINLQSPWIGNLYAPRASVRVTGGIETWGSIFSFDLLGSSYASFVFDRAILKTTACIAPSPPPGSCTRCRWCNNGTACVNGTCGACQADSDCCGLAVCTSNGTCEPLTTPPTK